MQRDDTVELRAQRGERGVRHDRGGDQDAIGSRLPDDGGRGRCGPGVRQGVTHENDRSPSQVGRPRRASKFERFALERGEFACNDFLALLGQLGEARGFGIESNGAFFAKGPEYRPVVTERPGEQYVGRDAQRLCRFACHHHSPVGYRNDGRLQRAQDRQLFAQVPPGVHAVLEPKAVHREHRDGATSHDLLGDAAEQRVGDSAAAVRTEYHEIGFVLFGEVDDRAPALSGAHEGGARDAPGAERGLDRGQCLMRNRSAVGQGKDGVCPLENVDYRDLRREGGGHIERRSHGALRSWAEIRSNENVLNRLHGPHLRREHAARHGDVDMRGAASKRAISASTRTKCIPSHRERGLWLAQCAMAYSLLCTHRGSAPMKTFRHVLVATDFGPSSERALAFAGKLAKPFDARITLVYAFELSTWPAFGSSIGEAREEISRQLANRAASLTQKGAACRPVVLEGSPAEAIVKAAADLEADAIVVGSHGRHGLTRAVLGSVAERVVRLSTVPVFTIHGFWFEDRAEAGKSLARNLESIRAESPMMLAISPGGALVAAELADAFDARLEILLVHELNGGSSVAGAICEDGTVGLATNGDDADLDQAQKAAHLAMCDRLASEGYELRHRAVRSLWRRHVVIVCDELMDARCALLAVDVVERMGPREIRVAAPIGTATAVAALQGRVSSVTLSHVVDVPVSPEAVYHDRATVSDEAVRKRLAGRAA